MMLLNALSLSSVLSEGMMIGVRLGTKNSWHGNIVYGVKGNILHAAYVDKFMRDVIETGCDVWIKYSNDYSAYNFSGKVVNIKKDGHLEYITIRIDTAEETVINNSAMNFAF